MKTLMETLEANHAGEHVGVFSVCSAHSVVLEAALRQSLKDESIALIEATANQVNQHGGYTGMQPSDFRARVEAIACKSGVSTEKLIFGGDHLGPTCWTSHSAHDAMTKARELVFAYTVAGFKKIHLDTSMSCADDETPLSDEKVAERAADLCQVVENAAIEEFGFSDVLYVIGTEVPPPGGATESAGSHWISSSESARNALSLHEEAFHRKGLSDMWERVVALVVQPGVEFDNWTVSDYEPQNGRPLAEMIANTEHLVFETHSTDYQTSSALNALIRDHFAILKVGPELTHAVGEALFALSHIEEAMVPTNDRANLVAICERAMRADDRHWRDYCVACRDRERAGLLHGLCDRLRYYWTEKSVTSAVERLLRNLSSLKIPLPLLAQYLPRQYAQLREGGLEPTPQNLILQQVMYVTARYADACRGLPLP